MDNDYSYDEEKGILQINGMKEPIIYKSLLMKEIFEEAKSLSEDDAPVIITGETGTGKGLVAKAIHYFRKSTNNRNHYGGVRSKNNFVKVNCGALVSTLAESELFGYVRGAFTDAKKTKEGYFSSIKDGTIFLDEIGNIGPKFQESLLGVIDDRVFRKVGQTNGTPEELKARIISATNSDLEKRISEGGFRKDLFYRLSTGEIKIPPLRDRKEDIPLLINHFLRIYCNNMDKRILLSHSAKEELREYHFPGNIRELENFIRRAVRRTENNGIYESFDKDLKRYKKNSEFPKNIYNLNGKCYRELINDFRRNLIIYSLLENNFNVSKTARKLGISRETISHSDIPVAELRERYLKDPGSFDLNCML